jgi:ribonuclease Y
MDLIAVVLAVLGGAAVAGTALYFQGRRVERRLAEVAARLAAEQAEVVAAATRQRLTFEAKEEVLKAREQLEQELGRRRSEIERREAALERRDKQHDDAVVVLQQREAGLAERDRVLAAEEQASRARLEQIAGLSAQEAKQELLRRYEDEARSEAAALARDLKEQAKREADREARKIVAIAIQRVAAEQTAESTVAAVALPSDEMKGRIIGREGRNIRAFEAATGVDVIIDDTPDTVVISCFDPVRREVGRLALERLIADGRIHPGRIEDIVHKAQDEIEKGLIEAGEQAVYESGIHGMHAELVKLVGRMKYRTSYGQNILSHSKEVAWLAGIMAAELKMDTQMARRGGLLHDVGKVLTHEHEGTHVQLGVEVATKYGEHPIVVNCIGSRPGARREAFETYVKRLTQLEQLAGEFPGVEKVFAIQAGREVRVVVAPTAVDDGAAGGLSDQIARRIERELQYPGQIKVVVIRETRAVDFAR